MTSDDRDTRKKYSTPSVIELGSLASMTRGVMSMNTLDSAGGMNSA